METVKVRLPLTIRLLLADLAERRQEDEVELLARLVRREVLDELASKPLDKRPTEREGVPAC